MRVDWVSLHSACSVADQLLPICVSRQLRHFGESRREAGKRAALVQFGNVLLCQPVPVARENRNFEQCSCERLIAGCTCPCLVCQKLSLAAHGSLRGRKSSEIC